MCVDEVDENKGGVFEESTTPCTFDSRKPSQALAKSHLGPSIHP